MKLRLRDIVSHQGRDFVVEGMVTYRLGGKVHRLARVVDGETVRWVEPATDDLDDRVLWLEEVTGLGIGAPPPSTVSHHGHSYLPRFSGVASVEVAGRVPDRVAGSCELWRFRAAGDLYLQVERWPDRTVILHGESVHRSMIDVLPAP
jgi:Domain of unknown function (DUF4178)